MRRRNIKKEIEVKKIIKPLCKLFDIKYKYICLMPDIDRLSLNGQQINCKGNTIEQIKDKVIGYIFVEIYCKNNSIGAFEKQTLNVIKKDWIKTKGENK